MKKKVIVISREQDCAEFGTLEDGVFTPEIGCMHTGPAEGGCAVPKYEDRILQSVDNAEPEQENDEEISCMPQQRSRKRARQCRRARGERIALEINWPFAIIGIWLYTLPFLMLLAGALLERMGL